jgi:hypothetical protein
MNIKDNQEDPIPKIIRVHRCTIPPENRTEGPTHITAIMNRMLFTDYYEEVTADQSNVVNSPDSPKSTVNNGGMINEKG